jgi:hypothetical protein
VREASGKTWTGISYATSTDGMRWSGQGIVLRPEIEWEMQLDEGNVGRPYAIRSHDRFELYYDATLEGGTGPGIPAAGVGLAWSEDGRAWSREIAPVFVSDFEPGESHGFLTGIAIVFRDKQYQIYYAGDDGADHPPAIRLAFR